LAVVIAVAELIEFSIVESIYVSAAIHAVVSETVTATAVDIRTRAILSGRVDAK